ncbi:MAG TPA: GntR family transcriptional regulator [Bordetella sp.]|nr:GntR family transcriptional regulator [Bordetella sp.]
MASHNEDRAQDYPAPLYAQVEASLVARIRRGELAAGAQLPPEDVLMADFGVSRTTIRATIQRLVQRGLVEIRRGKGTFVSPPRLTLPLAEMAGFVRHHTPHGHRTTASVLSKRVIPANSDVASELDLQPGTDVVQILRTRLADDVPMSFDETYLPLDIGRSVMEADFSIEPISDVLERRCDRAYVGASYRIECSSADTAVATALRITVGSTIFLVARTFHGAGEVPVQYEKLHFRGALVRFHTYLARECAA